MSVFNHFMYDGRGRMVKDTIKIFDCRNTAKIFKACLITFQYYLRKRFKVNVSCHVETNHLDCFLVRILSSS